MLCLCITVALFLVFNYMYPEDFVFPGFCPESCYNEFKHFYFF